VFRTFYRAVDAEGILQQFGNIPCKELMDEQRSELSVRLEKARETFKNLQMEDALNGVLDKFKCDLELHCEMAPNPIVEELTKNNIPVPVGLPPTVSVCKYEPRVNNLLQWEDPTLANRAEENIGLNRDFLGLPDDDMNAILSAWLQS
jgi:hypothetical protein